MSKKQPPADAPNRPQARNAKGFGDIEAAELRRRDQMIATIRGVYERYGFEPLETPAFEYTDALGKFLPDQDRPNAGVFSLQDVSADGKAEGDEPWMSLRYDLTAPLARYVAQNFDRLPKPYRRYGVGPVFRNEKPGPGRFRQFIQFDADTVGTDNIAADAELCMLAADTLEALGLAGKYVVKVNSRRMLDAILARIGIEPATDTDGSRRLDVLRAVDKLDRLGVEGVRLLLGAGRRDESGDFTKGAGLDAASIDVVVAFVTAPAMRDVADFVEPVNGGAAAFAEIDQLIGLVRAAGYRENQIRFDPSVVRGLEYYTGPVFEAELTFSVNDEKGQPVRFGSVGGGGRYDDLVARFTGERVPATGFSIGVSRLQAALAHLKEAEAKPTLGPVVVLVMDKGEVPRYQKLTQTLRQAGLRAEMYVGSAGMKPQMKYADRRRAPVVVIQGSNEREKGEVVLKDLIEGEKAASAIKDNAEYKAARPAQITVAEADLVAQVRMILARYE